MKLKVKKGDLVQVISGAEKGKKGKVLDLNIDKLLIKVEGIKRMTHFSKKDGLTKIEAFFPYCKIKLVESSQPLFKKKTIKVKKELATEKA